MLEIAHRLRITYYDASYIVTAYKLSAELVTDDSRLRKKIEEEIHRKILSEII
ncbi:MAG: type II toxin-antitoxin system VapC family toxin [Sulfolobales archaeon]